MSTTPLEVWYDGGCPICSREVAFYRRRATDGTIRWIDARRCGDEDLPDGVTRGTALGRLHARDSQNKIASGTAAFAAIWQRVPGLSLLGMMAAQPPLRWLLSAGYELWLISRRLRGARASR